MTDMRIAIACQDDSLRQLAYALVPEYDPANLLGITIVEDLIRAMNQGQFDVVVLDEAFENLEPDREYTIMVELYQARMPVVALMPRAPSFAEPASAVFERTAIATRAVKLDLPSTAAGMEIAIRGAIDNREETAPSGGPDYGRKRAWPAAWQEPEPDVNMDFGKVPPDQDPKSDPLAERPTPPLLDARSKALKETVETIKEAPPTDQRTSFGKITPGQKARWSKKVREEGKAAYDRMSPEAKHKLDDLVPQRRGDDPAGERSGPPPPPPGDDPMDALIEAAKAIVIEIATGKADFDQVSIYPIPTGLLRELAQALDDAGYAPW